MAQLDDSVGALLKHLEDIGEADNTIVIFTTDNCSPSAPDAPPRNRPVQRPEGCHRD
jgi:arylsulfatase A-like enzyme